jgi:hypothetical protein
MAECPIKSNSSNEDDFESDEEMEQQSFTEWCVKNIDLDNFPNPNSFLPLKAMGITTKEDFIEFWQRNTGLTIRGFTNY